MLRHLFRRSGSRVLQSAAAAAAALAGVGTWQALADGEVEKLSIAKLACHRHVPPPRIPTVLVSCGSFNPPTIMHLRMFDLATAALAERGYDVWGCYMSPVADAYGKKGLAPVHHRLEMCRLAAAGTDNVMVDSWEASQPGYTRTLQVLRHVASSLQAYMQPQGAEDLQLQQDAGSQQGAATSSSTAGTVHAHGLAAAAAAAANLSAKAEHSGAHKAATAAAAAPGSFTTTSSDKASSSSALETAGSSSSAGAALAAAPSPQPPQPQVMLLCGADLLATINKPGVWKDPDVILQQHGIVCICRAGTDLEGLLQEPNSVLSKYKDRVIVVQEPVQNTISSSLVRALFWDGSPVRYLVPDPVLAYIRRHELYTTEADGAVHV